MDSDGRLKWKAPPGEWEVLRFGYTITGAKVTTSSDRWKGLVIDYLDPLAFQSYWRQVVEPLIADAGPLAGTPEISPHRQLGGGSRQLDADLACGISQAPRLRFAALAAGPGRAHRQQPAESDRFLFDFRKTLGDLTIDNHYRLFRDNAHRHGLEIHPESGGPHAVPIDAQRDLGWDDVPDERILGLVVGTPHWRRKPFLCQAARFRRAHLRAHHHAG